MLEHPDNVIRSYCKDKYEKVIQDCVDNYDDDYYIVEARCTLIDDLGIKVSLTKNNEVILKIFFVLQSSDRVRIPFVVDTTLNCNESMILGTRACRFLNICYNEELDYSYIIVNGKKVTVISSSDDVNVLTAKGLFQYMRGDLKPYPGY